MSKQIKKTNKKKTINKFKKTQEGGCDFSSWLNTLLLFLLLLLFPRGKFAVVKKCIEKATGKQYAAKFLRKRRKGQDCRMDILNEIAVLELAKANPFVVTLHEVYETSTEIILVLEW